MNKLKSTLSILTLAGLLAATACSDKEGNDQSGGEGTAKTVTLLNVSYDPTRELYKEVNAGFARKWEADTGHRSEARRVGKECVSTCRSRWPTSRYKKKHKLRRTQTLQ